MTNKEKTILFLKSLGLLVWAGAAVITGASVMNGDAAVFVKVMAVFNIVINLALVGKMAYDQFLK